MKTPNIIILLVLSLLFYSCDNFGTDALTEDPPHLLTGEDLYVSFDGFQAGLNGLYGLVRMERTSAGSGSGSCGPCGGSDAMRIGWAIGGTDIYATNSRHRSPGPSRLNSDFGDLVNSGDEYISNMFFWLYRVVNTANTIIHEAENRDDIDWEAGKGSANENRNLVIAEARAMRAWAYRHLTFKWGDVPIVLEPSSGLTIRTDWTRNSVEEVHEFIIEDLLFAEQNVPVERSMQGRITRGAIQHYLSEMHLVIDNPETALFWADQVINTPEYQLITERYGVRADEPGVPFQDMFLDGNQNRSQGNTEALWVFQFALNETGGGVNHMRRHFGVRYGNINVDGVFPLQFTLERGGRSASRSSLTNFALSLWEDADDRGSEHAIRWFFILNDADQNAPYPADNLPPGFAYGDTLWTDFDEDISPTNNINVRRPYVRKVDAGADPSNISSGGAWGDWVYLRLGNTYLLKAEAEYKLGNSAAAAETINIIRRRANSSEINASDVDIDFILDERARELAAEEERKYTLIRNGKWIERTQAHNFRGGQNIQERHKLLPIPQDVIDANLTSEFPQNPGY